MCFRTKCSAICLMRNYAIVGTRKNTTFVIQGTNMELIRRADCTNIHTRTHINKASNGFQDKHNRNYSMSKLLELPFYGIAEKTPHNIEEYDEIPLHTPTCVREDGCGARKEHGCGVRRNMGINVRREHRCGVRREHVCSVRKEHGTWV